MGQGDRVDQRTAFDLGRGRDAGYRGHIFAPHRDGESGCVCAAVAVVDGVGDGHIARDASARREVDGAVGVDGHRAFRGVYRGAGDGQGVAVRIAVVAQDVDVADRRLVRSAGAVVVGHRRIVDRGHINGDGAGGGAALAIIHRHREAVRPVVVFVGRVGVAAVGVDDDGAVRGVAAFAVGQGVAIWIGALYTAGEGGIFSRGLALIGRGGGAVVGLGGRRRRGRWFARFRRRRRRLRLRRWCRRRRRGRGRCLATTATARGDAAEQQAAEHDGDRGNARSRDPQRYGELLAAQGLAGEGLVAEHADGV